LENEIFSHLYHMVLDQAMADDEFVARFTRACHPAWNGGLKKRNDCTSTLPNVAFRAHDLIDNMLAILKRI
jgi:hypothetical protein